MKNKKTLIIIAVAAVVLMLLYYFGFLAKFGIGSAPLNRATVIKALSNLVKNKLGKHGLSWHNNIATKAQKANLSFDEQMLIDINWTIDNQYNGNLKEVWNFYNLAEYM